MNPQAVGNLFKEMQLFDSVSEKTSRKAAFLEPLLCDGDLTSCQQSSADRRLLNLYCQQFSQVEGQKCPENKSIVHAPVAQTDV